MSFIRALRGTPKRVRERERKREREGGDRQRETDRQTNRERQRETERKRENEKERERERDRERDRERVRERETDEFTEKTSSVSIKFSFHTVMRIPLTSDECSVMAKKRQKLNSFFPLSVRWIGPVDILRDFQTQCMFSPTFGVRIRDMKIC